MNDTQDDGADRLYEQAEAVRAYLVSVRGGAPLLSSTDARILHGWLVRGVRIGAIVRGIDRAAARRLAQRVRAPLSLASCRAEVEKQQNQAGSWVRSARPLPTANGADPRFAEVERLAARADEALTRASGGARGGGPNGVGPPIETAIPGADAFLATACAIAAAFFDEAWGAAPREVLIAAAAERLDGARPLYDDSEWEEALEATARDELRQRYPRFTATWIAQEAYGGVD